MAANLHGCATTAIPNSALRLPESTLDIRSIQTRTLVASSELNILAATVAVLQDMEFNIDRVEKPLGVITASKVSDADDSVEKARLFFVDVLCTVSTFATCGASSTAKDDQHIMLTMVVLPSRARDGEYRVRITVQRVIYDKMDRIKVLERIDTAETYQAIFDNLRKSLFIQEGNS
jgi:hypothetical protein